MIPKIIHYCWFGNQPIPERLQKCMDSWKYHMPDYEIKRWDEKSFDVNGTLWTKQAYQEKKYAFVSDYVRLVALEQYGGIYLDTDVMLKKSLDVLCSYPAFTGFENERYITSAIIGCEAHFPLICEFLATYKDKPFINEMGERNKEANVVVMTEICKKHGLQLNDKEQDVADLHVFPRSYFCPLDFYHNDWSSENTMAVHLFDASWLDDETKKMIQRERKTIFKVWNACVRHIAMYFRGMKG